MSFFDISQKSLSKYAKRSCIMGFTAIKTVNYCSSLPINPLYLCSA